MARSIFCNSAMYYQKAIHPVFFCSNFLSTIFISKTCMVATTDPQYMVVEAITPQNFKAHWATWSRPDPLPLKKHPCRQTLKQREAISAPTQKTSMPPNTETERGYLVSALFSTVPCHTIFSSDFSLRLYP